METKMIDLLLFKLGRELEVPFTRFSSVSVAWSSEDLQTQQSII